MHDLSPSYFFSDHELQDCFSPLGLAFDNARRKISQDLQMIRGYVKTSESPLQILGSNLPLPKAINGSFVSELDRAYRHLWSFRS